MATLSQDIEGDKTITVNININVDTDIKNVTTTINGQPYQPIRLPPIQNDASVNHNMSQSPCEIVSI